MYLFILQRAPEHVSAKSLLPVAAELTETLPHAGKQVLHSVASALTAVLGGTSDVFFFDGDFVTLMVIVGDVETAVNWIRQACRLLIGHLRELLDAPRRSIPALSESVPVVDRFFLKIARNFACKRPELTALITEIQTIAQTSEHPDHAEILPVILNWQSIFAA
jgi:hypothetical protein